MNATSKLDNSHVVNTAADVLAAVRISDVYLALSGIATKHHRGVAVWRGGEGWSVSLSDAKGVWFDHAAGEGGGILDLVMRVRGCDGAAALRWVADLIGVHLDDRPLSPADRAHYARERRALERDLPIALLWMRAACHIAQQVVDELKAALFDPVSPDLSVIPELQSIERKLACWRTSSGAAIVAEYRAFLVAAPRLCAGMVKAAWRRRQLEERAAWRVLLGVTP
jgi:hypothetical protein